MEDIEFFALSVPNSAGSVLMYLFKTNITSIGKSEACGFQMLSNQALLSKRCVVIIPLSWCQIRQSASLTVAELREEIF